MLNLFNETQYTFYLLNKISNWNIFDLKKAYKLAASLYCLSKTILATPLLCLTK